MRKNTLNQQGIKRIAVGMSGGLDSSVVAHKLHTQGFEVVGLTAHMWKEGSRCCSLEDVDRARAVCESLGIRHYVMNAVDMFRSQIVDPFIQHYLSGRTPSPCILCNQHIKFGLLLERARQVGCDALATGHYAKIIGVDNTMELHRAADRQKDQSYFLHRLSQDQLKYARLPLGDMTKGESKAYALEHGLPVVFRSESQDLCFVTDAGHAAFIEREQPEARQPGPIVDEAGRELGRHDGFYRFTVGQRRGLGIASTEPYYVKALLPKSNSVVVGRAADVYANELQVDEMHWISGAPPDSAFPCRVQIRYRHQPAEADITCGELTHIRFKEPQFAVTPGQAAVLYDGEKVLGGGWIMFPRAS